MGMQQGRSGNFVTGYSLFGDELVSEMIIYPQSFVDSGSF